MCFFCLHYEHGKLNLTILAYSSFTFSRKSSYSSSERLQKNYVYVTATTRKKRLNISSLRSLQVRVFVGAYMGIEVEKKVKCFYRSLATWWCLLLAPMPVIVHHFYFSHERARGVSISLQYPQSALFRPLLSNTTPLLAVLYLADVVWDLASSAGRAVWSIAAP